MQTKKPRAIMGQPTDPPAVVHLGGGAYLLPGEEFAVAVSFVEDCVLECFLKYPALSLRDLVRVSGIKHAAKVLRRLLDKYPAMRQAVRMAGKKGAGGYAVRVVDGCCPQSDQHRLARRAVGKG
jgi:hypothetical protein